MPSSNISAYNRIYNGLEPSIYFMITGLNKANKQANQQTVDHGEECSICHDTLYVESGVNLAMSALPNCGHRFHEVCIMQWLSPIKMPPTKLAIPESGLEMDYTNGLAEADERAGNTLRRLSLRRPLERMITLGIDKIDAIEQEREELAKETGRLSVQNDQLSRLSRIFDGLVDDRLSPNTGGNRGRTTREILNVGRTFLMHEDLQGDSGHQVWSERPISRQYYTTALSHCCPLCRKPAFSLRTASHSDTLQLLRLRCRFRDFALALLNYNLDPKAMKERKAIIKFLSRRYLDTLAQNEREITPSPSDCQVMFNHVQYIIRRNARQIQLASLTTGEQVRFKTSLAIYELFEFNDIYIPFFFDPSPKYDGKISGCLSTDDSNFLKENPEAFFAELQKQPENFFEMFRVKSPLDKQQVAALTRDVKCMSMVDAE
ncbi:MAG: hypothetical protein Q9222_002769 [Ikaeria aurantiellina]